jgi:hypothetical protein
LLISSTWSGIASALRPSSGSSRGSPPPCCALASALRRGHICSKCSQRFSVPAHLATKDYGTYALSLKFIECMGGRAWRGRGEKSRSGNEIWTVPRRRSW